MKRLTAFLSSLSGAERDRAAQVAAYLAQHPEAHRLLSGPAPQRLVPPAMLRDWVGMDCSIPDWLIDTCRSTTQDLAETLALMLPGPPASPEPDLAEVLADLASLPPGALSRGAVLTMARRLPVEPRALYFRLVTGTFRPPVAARVMADALRLLNGEPPATPNLAHEILTVMIYAEAALATGARAPEITVAVWQGNTLVPIHKARPTLSAPQAADLMTWIRAEATGRFGPLRAVPARQMFSLRFSALSASPRRRSGLRLVDPEITAWHPDRDPTEAAHLDALRGLLADTP